MDNHILQELINYFENNEGYDHDDLVRDWVSEIPEFKEYYPDDYTIINMDEDVIMNLEDFSIVFYEKVIVGVCNVIKSFKNKQ